MNLIFILVFIDDNYQTEISDVYIGRDERAGL